MDMITWQSEQRACELKKGSSGPQEDGEVKILWGTRGLLQRNPKSVMSETKVAEDSTNITLQDERIRTKRHSPGTERHRMAIEVKKKKKGATETKLNFFML
jgi:hypothetical protein